jgi:carboxypeptidase Taq
MTTGNHAYNVLNERFGNYFRLLAASRILYWDSQAYMPPDGIWARGEVLAGITGAMHDLIDREDAGELFVAAEKGRDSLSAIERMNLPQMKRMWEGSHAVPKELELKIGRLSTASTAAWREAKANNDFPSFAKSFEEYLPAFREAAQVRAEALKLGPNLYDTLLEEPDVGPSPATVHTVLRDLEAELPRLLAEVIERQKSWPTPVPFSGDFSAQRQRELSYKLLGIVLNDPRKSRIDVVPHPFTLTLSPGDVRITTRYESNIRFAIMIALHESGHALYESNLPRSLAFSSVGLARGGNMHESQSLMVEMQAGRSREFLKWLAPKLGEAFGGDPACWTYANVLNTYRRVGEGFIRVEADEISYPLHMILRYKLEQALLSGDLKVKDLPGAWSDLSQKLFGRRPPNDAQGCLQDFHWTAGLIGYFPSYALGAALAAQYFERAVADDPSIPARLAEGDFTPYRAWVRPRIHERASTAHFDDIVRDATGKSFSADAFRRHLRRRYLEEPLG